MPYLNDQRSSPPDLVDTSADNGKSASNDLRGMSYEEGQQALEPPQEGSEMVRQLRRELVKKSSLKRVNRYAEEVVANANEEEIRWLAKRLMKDCEAIIEWLYADEKLGSKLCPYRTPLVKMLGQWDPRWRKALKKAYKTTKRASLRDERRIEQSKAAEADESP